MKATEQYFPVVLFIMLYKVFLAFDSVNEIQKCDHSNESFWFALSCDSVCLKGWARPWPSPVPLCLTSVYYCYISARSVTAWCGRDNGSIQPISEASHLWDSFYTSVEKCEQQKVTSNSRLSSVSCIKQSTQPLPTTTCTIQTTYWQHQRNRQTIDILLTIDQRTFDQQNTDRNAPITFYSLHSQYHHGLLTNDQ